MYVEQPLVNTPKLPEEKNTLRLITIDRSTPDFLMDIQNWNQRKVLMVEDERKELIYESIEANELNKIQTKLY